jgi:hypothetical protein
MKLSEEQIQYIRERKQVLVDKFESQDFNHKLHNIAEQYALMLQLKLHNIQVESEIKKFPIEEQAIDKI